MLHAAPTRRAHAGASLLTFASLALTALAACTSERLASPQSSAAVGSPNATPNATVASAPGYIRIGVVPEASTIAIGGTGHYLIADDLTGATLLEGTASEAAVTLASVTEKVIYWRVQVQCASNQVYVTDWVRRTSDAGYDPYTEYVPAAKCWRLRVGRFDTKAAALGEQEELYRLGLAPAKTGGAAFQVTEFVGVTKYQATLGDQTAQSANPLRVIP